MGLLGFILGMGSVMMIVLILSYVFWLFMFVDALKKRDILWIALFAFSFFTGFLSGILAALYYFIVYKKNIPPPKKTK